MEGFKGTRNVNGRPKGVPNKSTGDIRQSFQHLIENNIEQLQDDLSKLKSFERLKIIIELSKFVLPTLKASEISVTENIEPIFFTIIKDIE